MKTKERKFGSADIKTKKINGHTYQVTFTITKTSEDYINEFVLHGYKGLISGPQPKINKVKRPKKLLRKII